MGKIVIVSNDGGLRKDIQEEVNSFPNNYEISGVMSHISNKYGCNTEMLYPRQRKCKRYIYCYMPD